MDPRIQFPGNNITSTTTQSLLATSPQPQNPLSLAPTKQPIPSSSTSIHGRLTSHQPHTQQPTTEYSHQQYQLSESSTGPQQQFQQQSQSHQQAEAYPHQASGSGGPTATAPFLRDFSLVAEAAKRAQMSVVMRDLEAVTL
ncbi:uncharacterized protein BDW43DRAFT_106674 [Aspergillus alliaceus]|uniref:uncharacterized protein n=1 Tax=Petromyces alliaceus TaxID=209559 RepID=UPI0012A46219|nr:uncharacterized protein BDW43DRAFT_106674 [Aspergillus alliaceus]KAB8232567.1 hypothetical protein BDW43DRAFT_106674 [Aspergillus alliaceus]